MLVLMSSVAFVGLVHSLAPNHWLPVLVLSRTRKWSLRMSLLGAATTATAHFLISSVIGVLAWIIGAQFANHVSGLEQLFERVTGVVLLGFGLIYAAVQLRTHSHCHDEHTHHGPEAQLKPRDRHADRKALWFLFTLGLTPCFAAVPLIVVAGAKGASTLVATLVAFGLAVYVAVVGAAFATSRGLANLDHPVLEHYSEVITGLGIAVTGIVWIAWHGLFG